MIIRMTEKLKNGIELQPNHNQEQTINRKKKKKEGGKKWLKCLSNSFKYSDGTKAMWDIQLYN